VGLASQCLMPRCCQIWPGAAAYACRHAPCEHRRTAQICAAVTLAKSVKNAAELAGLREAHLRDGVALVQFLCWVEKTVAGGG
jgi:Xaa-Pro aminopeptidase